VRRTRLLYTDSKWKRLQEEYRRGTLAPVEERPPTAEVRIRAILASHADEAPCNAVRAEVWDVATAGGQGRAAAMLAMDLDRDGGAKTADPAPALPQEDSPEATEVYARACQQGKVVVLSTVLKEMGKSDANMDHLYLKLRGTKALAAALPTNSVMTSLRLRGNSIDAPAVSLLVSGLALNRTLRCLDLSNNALGDTGAANLGALVSVAKAARPELQELVLNQCEIGDAGVASLATALAAGGGNATLHTLRLRNNHLMDGAAVDLAALLKTSKPCALTELDLSWNSLGPVGAVALSQALRANCPLRSLHLEWNGLETKGGSALASVLHKNNQLRMLNLSHTRAGPEVCLVVCEALSRNTALRTLHLDSNPLGADGGRHLMWGLHSSRSLQTLTMKGSIFASHGLISHTAGFAAVNMQNPDGEYELNCTQPAERAVARQLMVINRKLGSRNITACKVGGGERTRRSDSPRSSAYSRPEHVPLERLRGR